MKGISELLPTAIGIAVVGGITWFLLDRNVGVGKWVLAALLFAHGWVHLMFIFPKPDAAAATSGGLAYPFDMSRSWLVTGAGLDLGLVRTVGLVVMGVVFVGYLLAALSTAGLLVPAEWWTGLVAGSAVASTVLLVLFFAPALLLGFAINGAVAVLVLASIWSPVVAGQGGVVG
jgi:hypothetical protein